MCSYTLKMTTNRKAKSLTTVNKLKSACCLRNNCFNEYLKCTVNGMTGKERSKVEYITHKTAQSELFFDYLTLAGTH